MTWGETKIGSSQREFELSRVRVTSECHISECMTEIKGKSILVRVSARFKLARVRVIGSRLYLFHFSTSTFLLSTTWVRTCLLLRRFVFGSHRGEPETRLTGEEAPKFSSRFSSRDVFVRGRVRTARTGLGRRHRFGRRPKPRKRNFWLRSL